MVNRLFLKLLNVKNVMFAFVLIIFLIFIVTCKEIVLMFFASFVIACSLNPIVDKLEKKMSRKLAATLVMLLLFLIIAATFVPVIIISAEELKNFTISFPKYVDKLDDYILNMPLFAHFNSSNINFDEIMASASSSSADIIDKLFNIGKNISSALIYLIVSIILTFNMIIDKRIIKNFYLSLFPSDIRKKAEKIGDIIATKMGGYLIALAATMFGVFAVMLIGLYICKNDYALILALITGVLDIIPIIGPGLALVICIISSYQTGIQAVVAIIIVFTIAQLIENNVVRPYIFGKFLDLHPLVIFLFLFIAAKMLGILGVIFAPAIAALIAVLFEELYIKNLN